MRIIRDITVAMAMFIGSAMTSTASAQDWYVGASVGVSHSMAENMSSKDFLNKELPSLAVTLGDNITPTFGLRLQAAFRPQTGKSGNAQSKALPDIYGMYRFNTATVDLSAMFNLSNIFLDTDPLRELEANLIAGVGVLNTSWFSPKVDKWTEFYPVNTEGKYYPTAHLGLQGLLRIDKHWKAIAELKCYGVDNEYNGVKGSGAKFEAFLDFQLGIVYYLSGSKREEIDPKELRHNYLPEYVEEPVFSGHGATLRNVMFYLGRSNLATSQLALLADVAQYLLDHPNYKLMLCGYPDDASYDKESNKRLAQRRLDIVREELIEMGIADERLEFRISPTPVIDIRDANDWVIGVGFELKK